MTFRLTAKQQEANTLIAGPAKYILLYGGSRSAKTFTHIRAIVTRALLAPGSRHAVLGFRQNRIIQAIVLDTFPKVLKLCFPNAGGTYDKQKAYHTFPNGSEVWFGGLDDAERSEKVLGLEHATILLNECSQISNDTRQTVETRLAQKVMIKVPGQPERELRLKMLFDENPPKKSHWTYKLFTKKINPDDGRPLAHPEAYVSLQMNPIDNVENLAAGYMESLNNLGAAKRRRFRDGEYGDANPNQLFDEDNFEKYRVLDIDELPDMVRIVVAVDPSGSGDTDNEDNDAIGIAVAGLGVDGIAYAIEDRTVKAGPATWGRVATGAYEHHDADCVVGEQNYGGEMVRFVIRTANPRVPYKKVTATRGKVVRAEPVAALYAQGKVRHVGYLRDLEDELVGFTTNGYEGEKSPNRADALIWAIYALFPALTKPKAEEVPYEPDEPLDSGAGY
ncbi:MAG: phage terminase large subunit [Betaproteobacteria bacterium]|nr:phage terminase large subunit [Betaproteobacteria bacterium]